MKNQIKDLIDPKKFHSSLNLDGQDDLSLVKMLESMIIIRKAEQQLAIGRKNGTIGGPVHLGAGQEAIAVGVSKYLKKSDRVFGAHRSHSHHL